MCPGTAMTSRPCSSACIAVMSAPDPTAASTTTVTRARPLIRRFRRGKLPAVRLLPGGNSLSSSPRSATRSIEPRIRRWIDDAQPVAEHPDRGAAGVERGIVRDGVEARAPYRSRPPGRQRPRPRRPPGYFGAVARVVPAAHDRHGRPLEQREIAEHEQDRRRLGDVAEQRRGNRDRRGPARCHPGVRPAPRPALRPRRFRQRRLTRRRASSPGWSAKARTAPKRRRLRC